MITPKSRITGPGAPFELEDSNVDGVVCRVFKRGPSTLSSLYRRASSSAHREFMLCGVRKFTYAEILARAHTFACFLHSDVAVCRGRRVAIVAGNDPRWLISFVAITSLGATAVAIHDTTGLKDILGALSSADCSIVITDARMSRMLSDSGFQHRVLILPDIEEPYLHFDPSEAYWASDVVAGASRVYDDTEVLPQSPALIAFTSGTTGRPKGVVLSHLGIMTGMMNMILGSSLAAELDTVKKRLVRRSSPVSLVLAPFSYVSGYLNLLLMWYLGGRVVALLDPSIDSALEKIQTEAVTSLIGATPALMAELLKSPGQIRAAAESLRSVTAYGGHLPSGFRQKLSAILPSVTIGTGYGMTETNGSVCVASGTMLEERPTTCGQPLPTVDMRIMRDDASVALPGEVGDIFIRGAMLMQRYCSSSETNIAMKEGWLRTGDLGRLDSSNYLDVLDRQSYVAEYDGTTFSPSEIERIALLNPVVREAVALGLENIGAREKPVLVVVVEPGSSCDSSRISESLLAAGVNSAVLPEIVAMESLPHTQSGKVDGRELRRRILVLLG
jgi:long-chain acyl-CoA synthetase